MLTTVDSTRAFEYQWRLWRLFGLHPPSGKSFVAQYYWIYSILYNVFSNFLIPLTMILNCLLSTTLAAFCETISISMPVACTLLKLANVWRMRWVLLRSHKILRGLDKRLSSQAEQKIISNAVKRSIFVFLGELRLFIVILSISCLYMLLSNERVLLFRSWVPWSIQDKQIYLITLSIHTLGGFAQAMQALTLNTYPLSYLSMVAAHIKALSWRIGRLGYEENGSAMDLLIDYIEDHQNILELLEMMESSLSMACLFQLFCTTVSLCAACFFVAYVKVNLIRIVIMCFLALAITLETLLICYAAEQVTHEGEQLTIAIYSCNWHDQSLTFRRLLIIMLIRSQRSTCIRAVIIPMSMTTLLMVLKSAYSLFTLLNEVS